jgi:hypothetical protein
MTWFKVDDAFALHPKAIAAGNAALGLWVRAGSWCGAHLTDGFVPAPLIRTLGAQTRDARKLVEAGLWTEVCNVGRTENAHETHTERTQNAHGSRSAMQDSQPVDVRGPGYLFKDWEQYQPTKAQVRADREAAKERQRRHREQVRHGVTNGVTDTVTNGVTNGAPTRPDPTIGSGEGSQSPNGPSQPRPSDGLDTARIANLIGAGTDHAWANRVIRDVMARAPAGVRDPQRYVEAAIRERPADYRPTATPPGPAELCPEHGRARATCPDAWHRGDDDA